MQLSSKQSHYWVLAVLLLLLFPGCKQSEEIAAPDELADLSKQTRPFVTVENTTIRTGPGTQFRAMTDIPVKAKVYVVGRDGDWALIVSKKGNPPGFVELAAIKPGEAEKEAKEVGEPRQAESQSEGKFEAIANTQVRSGPGLHYPSVAAVAKGTKLNVVDEANGWLKVESRRGNKPGYVEANLARPVGQR